MSEWISGSDLIRRWGIREFELIEHVRDGELEPHDELGQPYDPSSGHIPSGPGERIDQDELRNMATQVMELLGGEELRKLKAVCAISELPGDEEARLNAIVEELEEAASKEKKAELEARYIEFINERANQLSEHQLNQGLYEYLDTVLSASPAPGAAKSYFPYATDFSWSFLGLEAKTSSITRPEDWLRLLRLSMYKMEEVLRAEEERGIKVVDHRTGPIELSDDDPSSDSSDQRATARQIGDTWVIELGQELATCDLAGMKYIAHLLQHRRQRFKLLDLAAIVDGFSPVCGDMGEEFDRQTQEEITARYHELRGDIEEAEREGNAYLVKKYQEELEQLVRFLHKTLTPKQVKGILGKRSGTARAQDPSIRKEEKRIRKLLNDAYKKIGKTSPVLEKHLRRSITSVRDGGIAYNPDPNDRVSPNISQAA